MEGFASGIVTALGWAGSGLAWFATHFVANALTFADRLSVGIAHSQAIFYTFMLSARAITGKSAGNAVEKVYSIGWYPRAARIFSSSEQANARV